MMQHQPFKLIFVLLLLFIVGEADSVTYLCKWQININIVWFGGRALDAWPLLKMKLELSSLRTCAFLFFFKEEN